MAADVDIIISGLLGWEVISIQVLFGPEVIQGADVFITFFCITLSRE